MQPTTLTLLDTYCERAGDAALLAEPLNAVTNIVFMVGAVMAARHLLRQPQHGFRQVGDLWLLIVSLFSIGIGSTLWHLYATPPMLLADVLPITIFINIYIIASLRRLLHFSWLISGGCWGAYAMLSVAAQTYLSPDALNGSVMYLPAYLALVALMGGLLVKNDRSATVFTSVLLVFSISLILRTMDLMLCHLLPFGTHFLWHVLNAYVTYRLLMVLIERAGTSQTASR